MDPLKHSILSSPDNPRFKVYRTLGQGRAIKKHGLTLLAGRRLVAELLRDFPDRAEALLYPAGAIPLALSTELDPAAAERARSVPELYFTQELFRELDFLGAGPPIAVVRVPELPPWDADPARQAPGCTVFLPFGQPENLGAAIRTAAAFGVARAVLLAEAAHPYHPRALRAAAGQTPRLELCRGPAIADLDPTAFPDSFPALALDLAGAPLKDTQPPASYALIVGEEGRGLPAHFVARRVRIPMAPGVESLNAAVALAVALYAFADHAH